MRSLRRHLSYANVISTACLFLLLGGVAYAATALPKNSVGTPQLKKGAVTGAKIKDGTITGAKINSSTLGIVPAAANADRATSASAADEAKHALIADNAAALGGIAPGGFVQSSQVGFIDRVYNGCTSVLPCKEDVLKIDTVTLRASCENAAGPGGISLKVIGAERFGYSFISKGENRQGFFVGEEGVVLVVSNGAEVGASGTFVIRTNSRIISLDFTATAQVPSINTTACRLYATALAV